MTETTMDVIEETFHLRYAEKLSYREIAERTGKPTGTVMSRLARGRRRHGIQADHMPMGARKVRNQDTYHPPKESPLMTVARALQSANTVLEVVNENTVIIKNA